MSDINNPIFQDADKAREFLQAQRWPKGAFCPHCGEGEKVTELHGKAHRSGVYQCNSCREQFTVTVGTVFERSKIPLNKWLLAAYLISASKKGMSSHQIHRMLNVTYKTAWFMTHRIREAMKVNSNGLLGSNGGVVEVDETFWGNKGKQRKGARGYAHKMKVVSLVDRSGEKRSFKVENVTGKTLRPILDKHICKTATLNTDEFRSYRKIGAKFAKHDVVVHSKGEYVRGKAHTNTAECSFSLLKRGLIGTFHHVGEQHLQRYVTEFDFRWNHRDSSDIERATAMLRGIEGKRLMYKPVNL